MRLPHCEGNVLDIAMRLLAFGLDYRGVQRIVVNLNLPDNPLEFSPIDSGPAVSHERLLEFGVVVSAGVGLRGDSQ